MPVLGKQIADNTIGRAKLLGTIAGNNNLLFSGTSGDIEGSNNAQWNNASNSFTIGGGDNLANNTVSIGQNNYIYAGSNDGFFAGDYIYANAGAYSSVGMGYNCRLYAGAYKALAIGNFAKARTEYAMALGTLSDATGFASIAIGGGTTNGIRAAAFGRLCSATGQDTFAFGYNTITNADNAMAFGWHCQADGVGALAMGSASTTAVQRVLASGIGAINLSYNNASQTTGHGALANHSGAFAGLNHNIPSTSLRSVAIGGDAIKVSASILDTVHMPKVRIGLGTGGALPTGSATDDIISRDSATGALNTLDPALVNRLNGTFQTVNGSAQTVLTIPVTDETVMRIRTDIIGRDQAGTSVERAYYIIEALVYREGAGSATLEGVGRKTTIETSAGLDANVVVSGNNAIIQVTGLGGTTINWDAIAEVRELS